MFLLLSLGLLILLTNEKEKETVKLYKVSDVKILKTPKRNKNQSEDDESDVIIED